MFSGQCVCSSGVGAGSRILPKPPVSSVRKQWLPQLGWKCSEEFGSSSLEEIVKAISSSLPQTAALPCCPHPSLGKHCSTRPAVRAWGMFFPIAPLPAHLSSDSACWWTGINPLIQAPATISVHFGLLSLWRHPRPFWGCFPAWVQHRKLKRERAHAFYAHMEGRRKNKEPTTSQETFYLHYFEFILTPEHFCNFFLFANGIFISKAAKSVWCCVFQEQRVTHQCCFKSSWGSVDFGSIQWNLKKLQEN